MWTKLLVNAKAIDAIYSEAPSLLKTRLHEVRLHQDGPRVSLRIELNDYPKHPPSKWVDDKCNRVQLTLMLIDVKSIEVYGWSENNLGDVEIHESSDGVNLKFRGESGKLECQAGFVDVDTIAAYCDMDLEA
jgi:hypothetical protein